MLKGELVRCRAYNLWEQVGIVIEYDSLMKTVHVLIQSTGEVKKYRASHTELIKRAPQNKIILKNLAKEKEKA